MNQTNTMYHYKRVFIGPPAKRHLSADDGPTLNAVLIAVIFQGIRTSIAKKPNIFVIFWGVRIPPPLDPPMNIVVCTGIIHVKTLVYRHNSF